VNPAHLFLGTPADNTADMLAKGRQNSKLTAADVLVIRARAAAGESISTLAGEFGVSDGNISVIACGSKWRHIGGPRSRRVRQTKLSPSEVLAIRERAAAGERFSSLRAAYRINRKTLVEIVHGKSWKHVGGPRSWRERRGKVTRIIQAS
jgi:hypothetical protein